VHDLDEAASVESNGSRRRSRSRGAQAAACALVDSDDGLHINTAADGDNPGGRSSAPSFHASAVRITVADARFSLTLLLAARGFVALFSLAGLKPIAVECTGYGRWSYLMLDAFESFLFVFLTTCRAHQDNGVLLNSSSIFLHVVSS
jgi:hypothetical protein